jgi:GntR family transcriptional regulator, rspAB operon transcriptional repressor
MPVIYQMARASRRGKRRGGERGARESLAGAAHREIRRRIIFGDLRGGETFNVPALARELKVGRTPLREALQRLAREGLVRILPRKGILVADLSFDTLRLVFEARAPVEEQVARCAALRAEPADVERMRATLEPVERLIDQKQFRALVDADDGFHRALAGTARNPLLSQMLETLYALGIRFWYVTLAQRPPDDIKAEMALHREVLEAVAEHDPDKAAHAMLTAIGGFPYRVGEVLGGLQGRSRDTQPGRDTQAGQPP